MAKRKQPEPRKKSTGSIPAGQTDAKPPEAPENRHPEGARDGAGRFVKGVSGNPGGRPRGQREFAELLRSMTDDMQLQAQFCVDLVRGEIKKAPAIVRFMAAQWLTDRTIGKAPDVMQLTGKDGGPIEVNDARERLAQRLASLLKATDRKDGGAPPETPAG
jgi:hypothetical protein